MNEDRIPSPTIKQLRAFVAVYQHRKLSAAAAQLYVTQSAVSVLIRQLEEGLGVRLFDRTTRSLQPTTAATDAVEVAERILRDIDSLGTGLRDVSTLRSGRVTVAVTPTLGEILLPPVIRTFNQTYPNIQVDIDDCAPDQFVSRLVGEQADFGVGTPEQSGNGLRLEKLLGDHLSVVCKKDHELAKRRTIRWADLASMPVITVRPGYGIRPLIEQSAAQAGIRLMISHEVSFLETALWMTDAGLGPAIMPAAYVSYSRDPTLVAKPLVSPRASRDIYIVVKQGRSLSKAAEQLVREIKAQLVQPTSHRSRAPE